MKLKLILLLPFLTSFAFAQKATFKEIKLKAKPEFFNPKEQYATIFYPIISTTNPNVNKLINNEVKAQILHADKENHSILKNLSTYKNEGLTDLAYKVTFNKNFILSFSIYTQESGGNHLVDNTTYFNFDLKTGKQLILSDLLKESKIDSFQKKGSADKIDSLNKHEKEELNLLEQKEIDTAIYQWVIEEINGTCLKELSLKEFLISKTYIEIIDQCHLPRAIRSQEPTYHLKYSFRTIQGILNQEYRKRLLN